METREIEDRKNRKISDQSISNSISVICLFSTEDLTYVILTPSLIIGSISD